MTTPTINAGHPRTAHNPVEREDVDAAHRVSEAVEQLDRRGVACASDIADRLVAELGAMVVERNHFRGETTVVIEPGNLVQVATWMRDTVGFALLSDISPCDWLGSETQIGKPRFSVSYMLTKLVPGAPRLRLQVWVNDGDEIPSLIPVYPTADWHEREAYDFFGIVFSGRAGLRRLIMPEDWVGHPLRKDYPIGGEPVKFTNSLREI